MRRQSFALLSCLLACVTPGCVDRFVTIDSQPQGALVWLNGDEVGRTPLTREFTWYGSYDVELRKEGYDTLKTHARVTAPLWQWVPIDFVAEILPFRLTDRQHLAFAMAPASTQPAATQPLLDRAAETRAQLESPRHAPATQPAGR